MKYFLLCALFVCAEAFSATVTGTLQDISIQALNTKLLFAPTTNVLLTPTGLSAGPPKTIQTTNGQFSLALEAGDYIVSLPLIPWRRPFKIAVFATNGVVNITNLLTAPQTYTYTNQFWPHGPWATSGTAIFNINPGFVGLGLSNPSAPLEIKFNSGADTPKQLLLSATDVGTAVGLELKSPNSTNNWQLALIDDRFKIGKFNTEDYLNLEPNGPLTANSFAIFNGYTSLNNDGSAAFAGGNATIAETGALVLRDNDSSVSPLLKVSNDSAEDVPSHILVESTDTGGVGIQFQSPLSTKNWHITLLSDQLRFGKVGLADYLVLGPAGLLNASSGYAVGGALGLSTNVAVLRPGPVTNTLIFTKGILTGVQ